MADTADPRQRGRIAPHIPFPYPSHSATADHATDQAQNSLVNPTPEATAPWFYDMAFRSYWDHWRHVQAWLSASDLAYKEAEKEKLRTFRQLQNGVEAPAKEGRRQMRAERRKQQKQKKKKRNSRKRDEGNREDYGKGDDYDEDEEAEEEKVVEAACDNQDEFMQLLAQNRAFRENRDAYKRQEEENARRVEMLSSQTPKEQAGLKRTKEMSSLYGGESILIQTLETNLQMKFDEFSDAHRPPLWPSIPLNLSYGR